MRATGPGSATVGVSERAAPEGTPGRFLVEGNTCWRHAHADRAAVLVDAAAYFAALRASLLKARRTVFITGWELHSRTRIEGDVRPSDGAPIQLGRLVRWLLRHRPELEVKILLWNHPIVFSIRRELFPRLIFMGAGARRRVEVLLDSHLHLGASHHEKLVIIDDNVAYCGGIDLTVRRWDTAAHHPAEPKRRYRDSKPYIATHDVQMVVDGRAAAALGEWIRERWRHAGGKACSPVRPSGDAWPEHVRPDFTDVHVGVMRTISALDDPAGDILEIERATVGALSRAERFVYIENQYITSKVAYDALQARMRAVPALEAIVVTSHDPGGWLEARIMGAGRQRFMAAFADPELAARIHFVSPSVACKDAEAPVMAKTVHIHVHAKVLIVDDWFLRIGSSNLNNRSMGFDSECDLAIEAQSREQRIAITAIRNRLIAEHWGSEPATVEKAFSTDGPVIEALAALPAVPVHSTWRRGRFKRLLAPWRRAARIPAIRSVVPLKREEPAGIEFVMELGDPEHAASTPEPQSRSTARAKSRLTLPLGLAIAALAIGVLVFADLGNIGSSLLGLGTTLVTSIENVGMSPWRVPIVLATFVFGSIIAVPILAMIGATVLALGPVLGFAAAVVGMLLAATVTFAIGRRIGLEPLRRRFGAAVAALEKRFKHSGIVAIALIRKVPIAPFTIVNMLIGAIGIRYRDFIIGTALGMIPGIAAFAFVSDRVIDAWRDPTPRNIALIGAAALLWIGVVLLIQYAFNRRK
jgi:phospholipase D1/2